MRLNYEIVISTDFRGLKYLDKYNLATSNIKNTSIKQKTLTDFPRLGLEFLAITTFCILITVMLKLSKGNVFQLLPILGYFAASAFRILPSMNRVITSLQALKFQDRQEI